MTCPAAQFPIAWPDLSEHCWLVRQVPLRLTPKLFYMVVKFAINSNKKKTMKNSTHFVVSVLVHGSFLNVTILNREKTAKTTLNHHFTALHRLYRYGREDTTVHTSLTFSLSSIFILIGISFVARIKLWVVISPPTALPTPRQSPQN